MATQKWTVGGDRITYNGALVTPIENLTTVKLHLNKIMSTKGARYATMDIKNFYLGTPLEEYGYAKIPIKKIPNEIIDQ